MTQDHPTLLFVEDEHAIASLLAHFLNLSGYDVTICHDGRSAIEQVEANPPDFILSDIMLPDMTGPELIAAINARPSFATAKTLFFSSLLEHDETHKVGTIRVGDRNYPSLSKACPREMLLETLEKL